MSIASADKGWSAAVTLPPLPRLYRCQLTIRNMEEPVWTNNSCFPACGARRRAGACSGDRALQRLCRDGHSQPEPRASFSGGRGRACFQHIFRALAVLPDSQGREHPRVARKRGAEQDRRPAAKGAYRYAAGRRAGRNGRFSSRGDCQRNRRSSCARRSRCCQRSTARSSGGFTTCARPRRKSPPCWG